MAPHVEAVNHQHFFSFRLDMDVDGPENMVEEMNTVTDKYFQDESIYIQDAGIGFKNI